MPISVDCDECGYSFNAADKFAGKLVRCPDCSETVRVGGVTGSRSAALRAQPRKKSSKSSKAAPASKSSKSKPSRPSRPSGRSKKKRKSSGDNTNTIMIAGGVVILGLVGVIGFMVFGGGGDPAKNEPEQTIVEKPKSMGGSAGLMEEARDQLQAEREEEARLAKAAKESQAKAKSEGSFSAAAGSTGLGSITSSSSGSSSSTPGASSSVDLNKQVGDRISWLFNNGRGFAKKEDMWVYSGDPRALGVTSRSSVIGLSFYETLRTDEFVELFNQGYGIRVRLKPSEFIAFDLKKKTQTPMNGGRLGNSTADAGEWLADFNLPSDRLRETAIEAGDLPALIAAVEKQVARIDIVTAEGQVTGSGFLADESGRIVTNYHVVEGATHARAVFKDAGEDGKEVIVPVIGFLHVDRKRDIAVLQGVLPAGFNFRGLPLATATRKGEKVVAFGSPLGLDSTASDGIISGYRDAAYFNKEMRTDGYAGDWLQTTTPISSGNSGGPLVNEVGEVVAINTMSLTIGQQLNFAISAADIKQALERSKPTPTAMSPKNLPVAAHRAARSGGVGSDGRPRRSGKRIAVRVSGGIAYLWPIEGTPEAAKYLAELEEMLLTVATRNQAIETAVTDAAKKALKSSGIRVVRDEGPMLLVVPELRKATKNFSQLELFGHLYVVRNGEALRIWRGSAEDAGRISSTSLKRGSVGSKMKAAIGKFFAGLAEEIQKAKDAPADPAGEKSPFKD